MPISRDELLLAKKKRYSDLRDSLWYGLPHTRLFNSVVATELQILMMEINYLEQCPDASPDEISFMAPESTN